MRWCYLMYIGGSIFFVGAAAADLDQATRLILPGGAFDQAIQLLQSSEMSEKAHELVLSRKMSVIGVWVGMQNLGESSEEGGLPGLRWIDGCVRRLPVGSPQERVRLPHMGWNDVLPVGQSGLFAGLKREAVLVNHTTFEQRERVVRENLSAA